MKILAEPIDAIVKFKGREKPIPYKFRYADKEEIYHEIKIDKILMIEKQKWQESRLLCIYVKVKLMELQSFMN